MAKRSLGPGTLKRSLVVELLMLAVFAALLIRVLLLQTVDFEKYQSKVIDQLTVESSVKADRGNIYDRAGRLLATNVTAYRVFIAPRSIEAVQEEKYGKGGTQQAQLIATGLSEILEDVTYDYVMTQTTYTTKLDRTVARNVDEETAEKIRAFINENELNTQVYLEALSIRYYPYGSLACHLIGFTSSDGEGLYGIEYQYNEQLKGTPGKYITARDTYGNEMPYRYSSFIEAIDGDDVYSTIDAAVQAILEEQLNATRIESGAKNRVCGIVMDVETSEVLAMATSPGFDLNDAWALDEDSLKALAESGYAEGSDEYNTLNRDLLLSMWANKAITEIYIPGSTFKIITAATSLEEKISHVNESFTCLGSLNVLGTKIRCHKTEGHGVLTFAGGIQQSCNPIMMTLGLRLGTDTFYQYVEAFGYMERTGIDLPGEAKGIFFREDSYSTIDLAVTSFGQNFKVTPIQQLNAICAVANGGELMTPHVVSKIVDVGGKTVYEADVTAKRQVVSEDVCKTVSQILEEGVSGNGGAKNAYVLGYRVAAKTGTSEKVGDDKEARIASTVAYAPADDPKVAVIIMVDEPTLGSRYGSTAAAPYVANVMEQILPYLGVEAVYSDAELEKMAVTVPNLNYWTVALSANYLESLGLEYEVVGDGKYVTAQTPASGAAVEKANGRVILYTGSEKPKETIVVPDLVGKTAVAANSMVINAGLNIKIEGTKNYLSGTGATVVSQSPAKGTVVSRGEVVTVTFRYLNDEELAPGVE
ncbi:MAG: PASTA domain-containing protein [Clostridia bacterium]|nr:PASTA domain-containing protein [Clostridia bacterium]